MNNKWGGHNIDEEATVLKEIKLLYEMGEGKTFSFDHGNPNRPDGYDYHGHDAFKSFFQVLILVLLYTKSIKPKKNLSALLEIHSYDYAINRTKHLMSEKRDRFIEKMREKKDTKSLEKVALHTNEMKQLSERLNQQLDQQSSQRQKFYKFLELEIKDKSMISDTGLYDCWVYLTNSLKTKTRHRDPRAIIVNLINFLHKKKDSLFNTNFKKFFDIITSEYGKEFKSLSSFLTDFCEKKNIKKIYSTHPKTLFGIPDKHYTANLYFNDREELEVPDSVAESSTNLNTFLIKSQVYGKRNYGGTISLNEVGKKSNLNSPDPENSPNLSKPKKPKERFGVDNLDVSEKNKPKQLFFNKGFDLAVLHGTAFEEGFSNVDPHDGRRKSPQLSRHQWFQRATRGVKNNGHIFFLVNKKNIQTWSFYFNHQINIHRRNSPHFGPISELLNICSVISLKNSLWIILKKVAKEKIIKPDSEDDCLEFFDASSFVKETIKIHGKDYSLEELKIKSEGSETETILDHKNFFRELNKKESPYRTNISQKDFRKSGFNFNTKRWFMPRFQGSPLSSVTNYYAGEKPTKVSKIKLVDLFSYANKSSGGLDYQKIQSQLVPPDFHKKTSVVKIKKSCLLISDTIKGLNPVWFEYKERKPIYINRFRIKPLTINSQKVLGLFLEFKLKDKAIQKQLSYFEKGSTRIGYNFNEIMNCLKIKIPSLKKQQDYIDKAVAKKIKNLMDQAEEIKLASGQEAKSYVEGVQSDIDWLDHAIALPISNLNAMTEKLKRTLYDSTLKKYLQKIENVYAKRYSGKKLEDLFENLSDVGEEIVEFVEYAGNRSRLKDKEFKSLKEIKTILKSYEESSNDVRKIETKIEVEENLLNPRFGIFLNERAFKFMINEVVKNASKHGGFSKDGPGKITITISNKTNVPQDSDDESWRAPLDVQEITISIKNNGIPIPLGKEDFVKRGKRGNNTMIKGKGNGGAEVGKIADSQCLSWEIKKDPPEFVFIFDIKYSNSND